MVKKQAGNNEILMKIERIGGYVKKAERRIRRHEKAIARLRAKHEKDIKNLNKAMAEIKSRLKVSA
jgi:hypothetical protein